MNPVRRRAILGHKKSAPDPARDWRAEAQALEGATDPLRALYMDAQAAGATAEDLKFIQYQAGS